MPSKPNFFNNNYDLETVIIRGKGNHIDKKKKRDGETETRRKNTNVDNTKQYKLDNATEAVKPKRINPIIKQRIIKARTDLKLKQKDLAIKIQEQPPLIQSYENGKATANVNVLKKMEKVLKVKLTGKEFSGINV